MKIKSIKIKNVKSFRSETLIDFDTNINVIIGPNASGKSNLLDILTIVLKRFFLRRHQITSENGKIRIQYKEAYSGINTYLDKYLNSLEDSIIEISFIVKSEDIANIRSISQISDAIFNDLSANIDESYGNPFSELKNFSWQDVTYEVDEILTYKIANNQFPNDQIDIYPYSNNNDPVKILQKKKLYTFVKYLNSFNLFEYYVSRFNLNSLTYPFLFLSSYRGVSSDGDFNANLSSNNYASAISSLTSATSKATTSLITIATLYFSAKRRILERDAAIIGFKDAWQGDPEVMIVSKYLDKMGYKWDVELINEFSNIYQIRLEKHGQTLLLSQASSGEKEIINYLFGIFAMKVSNGLIIIDEPELHLHPRWQYLLLDLFKELSQQTGNQFIITTHSPVFVDVSSTTNIIRIYRENDESKHVILKDLTAGSVKELLHIVNTTNNEKVFFADIVILVEGITDRLVFQTIVKGLLSKHQILSVVEVIEINGKGNIKKFRKYLKALKIPYYFIADLDYINQVGTTQLKNLFITDLGNVDSNAIKNPKSTDGKKLIEILDEAIEKNDLTKLTEFSEYIKSFRRKIKDSLSTEEQTALDTFIKKRRTTDNEFILPRGDIEKYFPSQFSAKDLDNVLVLLENPEFERWQTQGGYQELEAMISDLLTMAGFINSGI